MRKFVAFIAATIGGIAAFLASLRFLFKRREDTKWEDASRPGKILAVDGVALHYVEIGPPGDTKGPAQTIVMIHGFGGHTFSFRHQLAEFGEEHRCVAIDLKGFGYSERPEGGNYSLTEQARLVVRAMDLLGIDRGVLIGHSMGGEVAMRIAAEHPQRVEKLILAASVSGERTPMAPRLGIFRPFMPGVSRLVALNAWRRMFYDRSRLDLKAIRNGYLAPGRIKGSMNTVWEMWDGVRRDRPIDYKAITSPVLIMWAERERIIPLASRALGRLRRQLPEAKVVTIPRTGHLLLEEQPEAANAAIRAFLSGAGERRVAEAVDRVAQPA